VRGIGHEFGTSHPVWDINGKHNAHQWAGHLGVRRPCLVGSYTDVAAVPWGSLPDRVILKPETGAGGAGVYLLERRGDQWHDLLAGRHTSLEHVSKSLHALARSGKVSDRIIVEEAVKDPRRPEAAPVDWKFYTFFGHVAIVLARAPTPDLRGGPPRALWRVFDEHWTDLGADAYNGHEYDASIEPPLAGQALVAVAAEISAAVPRPFLRVDLYEDEKGPVFGEITPEPGGRQRFRRDIDRRLGACWEEAEARLVVRSVRAGALTPATEALPESALRLSRSSPTDG
jgi:hypothetical protein